MTKRQDRDAIYVKRQFDTEIIVLCVRWYITYRLSNRDLVAMMAERDVIVSHTTIMRWVIRYVPEFEKRWNRFARSIGRSWRVDETDISIKGQWQYLYRAVDKQGRSIDFMLRPDRDIAAAQAFFRKALATIRIELRARSHSMATYRATGRCDCCDASTLLGAESKFAVQST
jgi:transposase-like protein